MYIPTWQFLCAALGALTACYALDPPLEGDEPTSEPVTAKETIIGIDLGTTFSCVGVWNTTTSRVHIIPDSEGRRITPSYVHFADDGSTIVGHEAKELFATNPKSTIYGIKRVLGREFDEVGDIADEVTYDIVKHNGKPYVVVGGKQYPPETISAAVLSKMKSIAQQAIGKAVSKAIITVPAYFNDAQRKSTMIAAKIAGLQAERIINEPTSAAIAYGLDKLDEAIVLVFDLGGGTFDVSLLTLDESVFQVTATNGDTALGGEDFDQNIAKFWLERESSWIVRATHYPELKKLAEVAKKMLSTQDTATVKMANGHELSLTREEFEQVNMELFLKTLEPVKKVLQDAKVEAASVDEVVLVGGSTRIPKVQELLRELFGGKELNKEIHPDEAVAYGASVHGASLAGEETHGEQQMVLLDVTPITLGIEIQGGYMAKIVNRNTPVPIERKQRFTSVINNQKEVKINIYEGERPLTKDNHLLDKFLLQNLPPGPKGSAQIDVTFEIDVNGILHVTAHDLKGNNIESIKINSQRHRLSKSDIARITDEAEKFFIKDKHEVFRLRLADAELAHPKDTELLDFVDEIIDWLNVHENDDPEPQEAKFEKFLKGDRSSVHDDDEL